MKSPLQLSDSLSLINLGANDLGNQRTMPARPTRGLFEEHRLLTLDVLILSIFIEIFILFNFITYSLVFKLHSILKG
jgi:hypothetical protein